jgi:hypothetical protein
MELIDRYIYAVGRHLPRKDRRDIQIEIRSILEDTLDNYAHKQGREVDDNMVVAVLEEFGSPEEIARSYNPQPSYLIGPDYYPAFKIGVLIYGSIVTIFYLFSVMFSLRFAPQFIRDLVQTLGRVAPDYISSIINAVGIMVIIFAILERVLPQKEYEPGAWDPNDLPIIDEQTEVKRLGLVVETAVTIAILLLLNFFPQRVGIYFFHDSEGGFVPMLGADYTTYLLGLNLWWVLSILLNLFVLRQGHWQRITRWAELGVNIIGVFVLYQIFSAGNFFGLNPAWTSVMSDYALTVAESLTPLFTVLTKGIVGLILLITVIEVFQQLYKLLFRNPGNLEHSANLSSL